MTIDRSGYEAQVAQIPERSPIPSKRQLVQELRVAPGTNQRALRERSCSSLYVPRLPCHHVA